MKSDLKNFTLGFIFGYIAVFAIVAALLGAAIALFLLFTWRFPEIIPPTFKILNGAGVLFGTFCGLTYKAMAE